MKRFAKTLGVAAIVGAAAVAMQPAHAWWGGGPWGGGPGYGGPAPGYGYSHRPPPRYTPTPVWVVILSTLGGMALLIWLVWLVPSGGAIVSTFGVIVWSGVFG